MFSPVACSQCGKPFQVQQDTLGKPTVCPWCQATVTALPVGAPAPITTKPPEPLSLDEAAARPAAPPAPARSKATRVLLAAAALLALVAAAGATVAVKQRKHGHLTGWEWKAYSPPDRAFTIELLGTPIADPDAPAGETRYVAEGWYSGTKTWVGWRDLTQTQVQLAGTKDNFAHFKDVFGPDRLRTRFGGAVVRDATTNFENPLTREVRTDAGGGVRAVERMLVYPSGPRPRAYFVGIAGTLDFDDPAVARLFDSFRVAE
jgi:hypothetical protein